MSTNPTQQEQMQCAHPGCGCMADEAGGFCSDDCREHTSSGPTGEQCGCGHDGCTAA